VANGFTKVERRLGLGNDLSDPKNKWKSKKGEVNMKIKVVFLGVLVLAAGLSRAKTPASNVEQEIRDTEQKFNAAYAANDLTKYFSFYSADFTQWLPEGRTDLPDYQKQWTSLIQGGARVESDEISDMHIQIGPSGDSAVASYILHVRMRSAKGEISEEDNQESDVLFKRDGAWKIVFLHYSPAPKKKAQ
jgi:ketosteroid isomerase-like protein